MNITIFGAGAIGSLLGAYLSRHHDITLIGRPPHITAIQQHGLTITGKTRFHKKLNTATTLKHTTAPDLIIVTVKAYDTATAAEQLSTTLSPHTTVLTIQNGLGNIEALTTKIPANQLLAGILTHGALLTAPGTVAHTGTGEITIGELDGTITDRAKTITTIFTDCGLPAIISTNITRDIWNKTIVNSSINPLTAFFACRNGYLQTNPILSHMIDDVCTESTTIAQAAGITVTTNEMLDLTHHVIQITAKNYSSMLQSIQQGKPTEINALNQALAHTADEHHIPAPLNHLLVTLIQWKEQQTAKQQ